MWFTNVSMTGVGIIIFLVMGLAQWLGIPFDQTQASIIAKEIVDVVAFVFTVYGQLRRKDLSMGLFRI